MAEYKVPKRIANIILNALQGGVVPRNGLGYIAVGRSQEIKALLKDIEVIDNGGSTFRFIVGNYGSGKTFLMQTLKEHVIGNGFIVADADLSPERSLVGSNHNKRGLATYRELMSNISVKTQAEGGALEKVLDNWLNSTWMNVAMQFEGVVSGQELQNRVYNQINSLLHELQNNVHGYNFSNALLKYWYAFRNDDLQGKENALRWLKGEYQTKTEAWNECGINCIINDDDWFDYIKLFAVFFRKIGYKGFIIMIDEMINIYRQQSLPRQKNYEKMLAMYNDALQGRVSNLGIIMGGTPKSVECVERGVFSYEALRSRLQSTPIASPDIINLMSPIIRIQQLNKNEIIVLLEKLSQIHADVYDCEVLTTQEEMVAFIECVYKALPLKDIRPRYIIKDFINVLNILYQNPTKTIQDVIEDYNFSVDPGIYYYERILES